MHDNGATTRFSRRAYPLQKVTKGSSPQISDAPTGEARKGLVSVRPSDNSEPDSAHVPWYREVYSRRPSIEDPAPQYSSTSRPEDDNSSSSAAGPIHIPQPQPNETNGDLPHVNTAQSSTETNVSQEFHTPPLENSPPPRIPEINQGSAHMHANQWTQRKYPGQSFTGIAKSLPSHPRPREIVDAEQPNDGYAPVPVPVPTLSLQSTKDRSSSDIAPWARPTYPSQSTTEVSTEFPEPTSRPDENRRPPSINTPENSHKSAVKKGNQFSRPRYPLQSALEEAVPQMLPTPPLENEESHRATSSKKDASVPVSDPGSRLSDLSKAPTEGNAWTRKQYPSQSLTNGATTQQSPPMPSLEQEPRQQGIPPSVQYQEKSQFLGRTETWQRRSYPLQSSSTCPPPQYQPGTPSSDNGAESDKRKYPVQLPRNVRAAVDANNIEHTGRTIVVCLDGTGDKFDNDNSNIVHLVSCLKKDDPSQVTYYQAGIGTYSAGGLSSGVAAAMDMAVGSGLGLHVRDAYHFLMHTYKEGDKICIFGFSRGAYTARCLAGMVHKVGLLPPRNIQQIPFAYEFYANATPEGWTQSDEFKKTFCIDVNIYFLGLFDSVASVGFIPRQLPLSSTPTSKSRHFRHAMALDERRAKFKICRHQVLDLDKIEKSTEVSSPARGLPHRIYNFIRRNPQSLDDRPPSYSEHVDDEKRRFAEVKDDEYEKPKASEITQDTDVLEVWFLGAHADVGGGAVKDVVRHKLSHVPLRWMIRQCFECNTGIIFKTKVLAEQGLDVHMLWPKYGKLNAPCHAPSPSLLERYHKGLPPRSVRRSKLVPVRKHERGEGFYDLKIFGKDQSSFDEEWTPEHVEDFFDAMSPMNDQLEQVKTWWILEVWPVQYKLPKGDSHEFYTRTGMNLGRYRAVEDVEPKLHWTVVHRMREKGYKINARTAKHTDWRAVV